MLACSSTYFSWVCACLLEIGQSSFWYSCIGSSIVVLVRPKTLRVGTQMEMGLGPSPPRVNGTEDWELGSSQHVQVKITQEQSFSNEFCNVEQRVICSGL